MAKNKTKLIGEVINPKNITPTRHGMEVSGKNSANKRNSLVGKSNKRFRLQLKFKNISKEKRLKYLISQLKLNGCDVPDWELARKRRGFNYNKGYVFPLHENVKCYVCDGVATIRHHVLPLGKGGRNKLNNIVPLCHPCHCKVHPHMQKGAKLGKRVKILPPKPALRKPTFDIVVIPPPVPKKV
jgi:5-methylcytosine-specific restriction endonuclease McrA